MLARRSRLSTSSCRKSMVFLLASAFVCQCVIFSRYSVLFQRRAELLEQKINTGTHHNSSIIEQIWHRVESDHTGYFRVRFAPHAPRDRDGGRPVLRIRIVGPQLKLLHSYRSNQSDLEWITPYSFECAGKYSVEITPLFEEFYDEDISRGKILPQWPPFVQIQTLEVPNSQQICQLNLEWHQQPFCDKHLMELGGSWVVDDVEGYNPQVWNADKVQRYLARTKMYPDHRFMTEELYQRLLPGSIDRLWNATEIPFSLLERVFSRLQYRYFHCRPYNGTKLAEMCRARAGEKQICFIGDSQTRFLRNGFVETLEPENTECSTIKNKEICPTKLNLRYIANCYGEIKADQTESCEIVLLNFGQWPLSWVEERPYSASQYQAMVREELATFENVANQTVFWISTNTMALNGRIIGHLDWRHDPAIELYNRLARREAERFDIPVIDIFSISSVLNDLSVDRSHYKAPVLTALVHAVGTIVCQQENIKG